ncbi:hypothetical protein LJ739_05980 [Aestuariibacter halophilus]|uniref:Peptidase M14 domain-containing protein n=1 Tax=Fluctibacter halophilus TaxID=226011 RepID=A0ABS8G5B6_9ALTE|nr:M14 family zinc carboxypeptidase [Aestuariibacter halophilus]MCC2615782.1 hypothetical protein [Aestuariibacter halophilus]
MVHKTHLSLSEWLNGAPWDIEQFYQQYSASGLGDAPRTVEDFSVLLAELQQHPLVRRRQVGSSYLGQPLWLYSIGQGPISVFAWSQMHGNEPVSTAALLDAVCMLLNDEEDTLWKDWSRLMTFHFLPMLNPDGADANTRHNAQSIDINRDASALQSPEGRVLHQCLLNLKPDYAFNMHDQSRFYTAQGSGLPSVMAVLTPPANSGGTVTPARARAARVLSHVLGYLPSSLQDYLSRYRSPYSSRAFGDFASSKGISCMLLESGYLGGDQTRSVPRKVVAMTVLAALDGILTYHHDNDVNYRDDAYWQLPLNVDDERVDVLIQHLQVAPDGSENFAVDVGINRSDVSPNGVVDIGDLRHLNGFVGIDARGLSFRAAEKVTLDEPVTLSQETYLEYLRQGQGLFCGESSLLNNTSGWPAIWQQKTGSDASVSGPTLGNQQVWFIANKSLRYAVLGDTVIDLERGESLNQYI